MATGPAHYVDLAVGLGCNAVYRRHVEQQIRETSDVLFEERAAADDFQELMQFLVAEARGGVERIGSSICPALATGKSCPDR